MACTAVRLHVGSMHLGHRSMLALRGSPPMAAAPLPICRSTDAGRDATFDAAHRQKNWKGWLIIICTCPPSSENAVSTRRTKPLAHALMPKPALHFMSE
jgi:hypothetical protein